MTITLLGAEEGETQGDVVVALGVRASHVPAHTFIHAAIVPNQEAARQGNMDCKANLCNRTPVSHPQEGQMFSRLINKYYAQQPNGGWSTSF